MYLLDHEYTPRALKWTQMRSGEYEISDLINTEASVTHCTGPDAARLTESATWRPAAPRG